MICEYGCGIEAIHKFKNDKWCCSKNHRNCKGISKNISKSNIGKKFTKEHRKKLSKSNIGKKFTKEHRKKLSISRKKRVIKRESIEKYIQTMKGRKLTEEHKQKISITKKKQNIIISDKQKEIIRLSNTLTINKIKERYPLFSKIEEMRYNPDKPGKKEIQVHCKNHKCRNSKEQGEWFTPTRGQLSYRIQAIERPKGYGEANLYCSDKCKDECPLYGKTVEQLIKEDKIKAGILKVEYYTTEEYNIWRQEVLERANKICEYCGELAKHCHHIQPQKLEPFFSLDPDNGLACCEECHYKYGHKDECSSGNLAKIVCI